MVKIRDLGINFIPQTMQPPEIGAGGGGLDMPGAAATHQPWDLEYECEHGDSE